MKQFLNVLKFEYAANVKNKAFAIVTILLVILMAAMANIPNIAGILNSFGGKSEEPALHGDPATSAENAADAEKNAVIYDPRGDFPIETLEMHLGQYNWTVMTGQDTEWMKERIIDGDFDLGLEIDGLNFTQYVRGNDSMFGSVSDVDRMVVEVYRDKQLEGLGVPRESIDEILNASANGNRVALVKDLRQSYWLGYAMLMLLYMTILMYGQFVMTSVITEKSSKTMELLITSVKPVYLIFGKVIGAGLAGLTQLAALGIAAGVSLTLTMGAWNEFSPAMAGVLNVSATYGLILYALIFFLLGFFIFAFLYAAFSSTVSRMEDARNVITIPMLLFVAAFMVAMFSMSAPEAGYVKVCSFVPFLSPLVMFMRICVTDVPAYQIAASIAVNVVSIIVVGILSAKIYKTGVLMYGKPPKLGDLVKYMIKA